MQERTVVDAVTAALVAEDTEVIFALMGDGNLDPVSYTHLTLPTNSRV